MVLLDFNGIMHFFNLGTAIVAVICSIYLYMYEMKKYRSFPRNLRIVVLYFCFFIATLLSTFNIGLSAINIYTNNTKPFLYHIFRCSVFTISQQLRFSYICIILDRTAATIFLEKYTKLSANPKVFIIFFILSVIAHLPISMPVIIAYINGYSGGTEYIVWTGGIMHIATLISCRFLQLKNQQMYKLLAYHCTLQQRHQIVENIKVLKILWPEIFVFSIVAPIGPAETLIQYLIIKTTGPIGMFFMTYNLTAIVMTVYYVYGRYKKTRIFPSIKIQREEKLVVSPLGNGLPTHMSQDKYFNDLKHQWN